MLSVDALRKRPQTIQLAPAEDLARLACRLTHLAPPLAECAVLDLALEQQRALVLRVVFEVAGRVYALHPLGVLGRLLELGFRGLSVFGPFDALEEQLFVLFDRVETAFYDDEIELWVEESEAG